MTFTQTHAPRPGNSKASANQVNYPIWESHSRTSYGNHFRASPYRSPIASAEKITPIHAKLCGSTPRNPYQASRARRMKQARKIATLTGFPNNNRSQFQTSWQRKFGEAGEHIDLIGRQNRSQHCILFVKLASIGRRLLP